mgnify:CR=1 FL=1
MQQLFGVLIVVIHHILAVPLGGGRARTFVENRFDIAELFASHNLDQEVFLIHIVRDIQIHQVHKLGAVFQVIHHQNIGDAFVIQALTMLLPIKPAPPVTMIITVTSNYGVRDNLRHECFYHITTRRWLQPFAKSEIDGRYLS